MIDEYELFQIYQLSTFLLIPKTIDLKTKSDLILQNIFTSFLVLKNLLFGRKQEEFTLEQDCILKVCKLIIPEVHNMNFEVRHKF